VRRSEERSDDHILHSTITNIFPLVAPLHFAPRLAQRSDDDSEDENQALTNPPTTATRAIGNPQDEDDEEDISDDEDTENEGDDETLSNDDSTQEAEDEHTVPPHLSSPNLLSALSKSLPGFDGSMAEGGPALVRFEINGHPVGWDRMGRPGESGKLSVFMSMFSNSATLSPLHLAVCLSLSFSLSSFASSQTLSRLHATSAQENVGEEDFRIVKGCVKRHNNTVTSSTLLHLERIKTKLAHLSSKAGYNTNEHREFSQLVQVEFEKSDYGKICVKTKDGIYYSHKQHQWESGVWVILRTRQEKNIFEVKVYHPSSRELGSSVSSEVLKIVSGIVKRAHQIVKLKELNSTRIADPLMLPEDHVPEEESQGEENKQNPALAILSSPLPELACPLVFETSFLINHRLKTSETRRALQSSVLHPFGVSNRRGAFVYKDELERVFWMSIDERNDEGKERIGLKVYGIEPPGPSITEQLTSILRSRISSFALDALSAILRNNTRFTIEFKDFSLLKSL